MPYQSQLGVVILRENQSQSRKMQHLITLLCAYREPVVEFKPVYSQMRGEVLVGL